PWEVGSGYGGTGADEKYLSIEGEWYTVAQVGDVTRTKEGNELHARILAGSYEMLSSLIAWCVESEEHFEPTSLFEKTIAIIEKALGLPWPEIRKRLEE